MNGHEYRFFDMILKWLDVCYKIYSDILSFQYGISLQYLLHLLGIVLQAFPALMLNHLYKYLWRPLLDTHVPYNFITVQNWECLPWPTIQIIMGIYFNATKHACICKWNK